MHCKKTIKPHLALEMTMHDVLAGMEDFATEFAFHDMGGEFEILGIEPATPNLATEVAAPAPLVRELFSADIHRLARNRQRVA